MPARRLPNRPSLEQYKKQAKELVTDYRAGVAEARLRVREHHPRYAEPPDRDAFALADAHLVIAREHGLESWPKFVERIAAGTGAPAPAVVWGEAERAVIAGDVDTVERLLRAFGGTVLRRRPQGWPNERWAPDYRDGNPRSVIFRAHAFDSWQQFARFADAVRDHEAPVARFEAAVDAVVSGETATLEQLVRADPALIGSRSMRGHHSTLLHYVGANGVEGFRQRTPANAADVARFLLEAGADVNAVADLYGGSTTLALAAASVHVERAGVQQRLLGLLIDGGADLDHPATGSSVGRSLLHSCLANGQPEAAAFLARRGARLDLEAAAGIGLLDNVKSLVESAHSRGGALMADMEAALVMAATYGHAAVVEFLLDRGVAIDVVVDGFSGLNWAATQGHLEVVRLFLARGASPEIRNSYDGTAVDAALWGAANRGDKADYVPVVEILARAGARVLPAYVDWWRHQRVQPPDVHARILSILEQHVAEA
jgi:ankyrin repeat protein